MTEKTREIIKTAVADLAYLAVGGVLYAAAFNMFLIPGNVYTGGVGGIATVLTRLYGLPTGTLFLLMNLPLMLVFTYYYGIRASVKSAVGVAVASALLDLTEFINVFPRPFKNPAEYPLLCAIFGGALIGAGIGLVFMRGYTMGGTDFVAYVIRVKKPNIPTSKIILLLDAGIIVFAAVATKDFSTLFYSFLAVAISSVAIDAVLNGFEKAKMAFIFSDKYSEIADSVVASLGHGVTVLHGVGWFTKKEKNVLLCIVKKGELYKLRKCITDCDKTAFVMLGEASQIIGEGFSPPDADKGQPIPKKRAQKP